ncbi:MAG: 30S ribosomal protein S1 [Candidatus Electrothrix aestuarii]|uniref:30S ribosomal protein S1 n=1 Tax=Candidatus Electrothrix aestuarii TaxID=3062594 RepID=A0AAU8LS31_9BACT|nr:30S ribosomal protein S1 [Candidatus Electrothrix aestuarii]WPD21634.1 MAG: 30S ribosomal protein S1 [Candidatus Electrothrix sp. GW3-3]
MSEEQFADLFQDKTGTTRIQPGDKIDATIADINGENIFLDLGGKSEGILGAAELRDEQNELTVTIGDTISVFLLSNRGGEQVFTTKIGTGQVGLEELEQAFHNNIPVQGKVTAEIKGGFQITIAGQRGFCPYSQIGLRRVENAEEYLEQNLTFKVIEFGNRGRNIILSARAVQEEEREHLREQLQASLSEGDKVEGTVSSLQKFGAFVDLGGVDGLIPISELAWGQTDKVEDVLSLGQRVEVIIKKLDWAKDRISLSLKDTLGNPWDKVEEKYTPASIHSGMVSRLAQFGAFVTLEPGIDGLLHISKLGSGRRINHPREVLEAGQEVTVKIDSVDLEKKRISLVPEDYTAKAEEEKAAKKAYAPTKESTPQSMGTLGDLLQAQMKQKKK